MPAAASPPTANERRRRKRNGIHYTPPELATFLAEVTARQLPSVAKPLDVLDPACGAGGLLAAFAKVVSHRHGSTLCLHGYETDLAAIEEAKTNLDRFKPNPIHLKAVDFLQTSHSSEQSSFDVVIANPPYVRTQTLGAAESQRLAKRFGLSGRVDLSQAFVRAMADVLRPGGVLGLLTSNRFLSVKSGAETRRLLRCDFEIREIYDLGDTKLFEAAVLPVIIVAVKRHDARDVSTNQRAQFQRIYEKSLAADSHSTGLFEALSEAGGANVVTRGGNCFGIERGHLADSTDPAAVWRLSRPDYEMWLNQVRAHQVCTFDDVAEIRVGIKTTADKVFVRDDWNALPAHLRPEGQLLRPLITHREVERWRPRPGTRSVLYPYLPGGARRTPISLDEFPQAAAYLHSNASTLKQRRYLIEGGRKWYEIWVPHDPNAWAKPKIVFPDIAAEPRFCLDESGSIVQGDCYWISLKEGADPRWLWMMLAVANATFITRFYDLVFHNKLYAGRRRFMTQYVKQFPLPPLDSSLGRRLVSETKRQYQNMTTDGPAARKLDRLVSEAFGVDALDLGN